MCGVHGPAPIAAVVVGLGHATAQLLECTRHCDQHDTCMHHAKLCGVSVAAVQIGGCGVQMGCRTGWPQMLPPAAPLVLATCLHMIKMRRCICGPEATAWRGYTHDLRCTALGQTTHGPLGHVEHPGPQTLCILSTEATCCAGAQRGAGCCSLHCVCGVSLAVWRRGADRESESRQSLSVLCKPVNVFTSWHHGAYL